MEPTHRPYLDALEGICARLVTAYERCGDPLTGWFPTHNHDERCPAHVSEAQDCCCGADELRAAVSRLTAALLLGPGA